jgi:hypothetical protein
MSGVVIQAQLFSFPTQRVAVNPQSLGSLGLVSLVLFEHAQDELLLKFGYGFGVLNPTLNHVADESFDLVFHGGAPRLKCWYGWLGLLNQLCCAPSELRPLDTGSLPRQQPGSLA